MFTWKEMSHAGRPKAAAEVLGQHVFAGGFAACQQQVFAAEQRRQRLLPHLFAIVGKGRGRDARAQCVRQGMGSAVLLDRYQQSGVYALLPQSFKEIRHCTNTSMLCRLSGSKPAAQLYHSTIVGICVGGTWRKNSKERRPQQGPPLFHEERRNGKTLRIVRENCAGSGVIQTRHLLDGLHGEGQGAAQAVPPMTQG